METTSRLPTSCNRIWNPMMIGITWTIPLTMWAWFCILIFTLVLNMIRSLSSCFWRQYYVVFYSDNIMKFLFIGQKIDIWVSLNFEYNLRKKNWFGIGYKMSDWEDSMKRIKIFQWQISWNRLKSSVLKTLMFGFSIVSL